MSNKSGSNKPKYRAQRTGQRLGHKRLRGEASWPLATNLIYYGPQLDLLKTPPLQISYRLLYSCFFFFCRSRRRI